MGIVGKEREAGFVGLKAVGNDAREEVDCKVSHGSVTGMLNLRKVFELIEHRLNEATMLEDGLIKGVELGLGHVFAYTGDQGGVVVVQELGQPLSDIAFVGKELAKQSGSHRHVSQGFTVIDIACGDAHAQ